MLENAFLRPAWLSLLILLPVLVLLLRRFVARRGSWEEVIAPELRRFVLADRSTQGVSMSLLVAAALAYFLAVVALAGPKGESFEQPYTRAGDALVVVLDLSQSMNSADLRPSRLARARLKLKDLLERRRSGETALIVYSANAFTVVPLTQDTATIDVLLDSLSSAIMPSRGSYPALALEKAGRLLAQAGVNQGQVLLIADGAGEEAALAAARQLVADGHRLAVLGVGTPEGGPIPADAGGFLKNRDGKVAVVRLAEGSMRRLARAGGGSYQRLRVDNADLDALFADPSTTSYETEAMASENVVQASDLGVWLVLALLPLVALQFRRGWLYCLVLAGGLSAAPEPAYAFSVADLFRTNDQQGARHMEAEEYPEAAARFEDREWKAAAQYRAGEFENSAATLADIDTSSAHYNRGNALARSGAIDAAIDAYTSALALDPEHADALYNKALLEAANDETTDSDSESPNESNSDEQESSSDSGGEQGEQDGESQGAQQSPGSDGDRDDSQSGEPEDGTDESAGDSERGADLSEEEQAELQRQLAEAMAEDAADQDAPEPGPPVEMDAEQRAESERERSEEQLLRLIQHDPGALLRRKFHRQYRQLGRDQDGQSLWPDNEAEPW